MINQTFKTNTRSQICIKIITGAKEKTCKQKTLQVFLTKLIKSSLNVHLDIELLILFSKDKT